MSGRRDKRRFDALAQRSPLLGALAASKAIRECVQPLINQPYRLIESYALYRQSDSVFYLHNGRSEYLVYGDDCRVQRNMSFAHTFHNGKLYCMFIKFLVYLNDVTKLEDGPFCYIQGSHKANFSCFEGTIEESGKPELTQENFPSLVNVPVEAGDALILNEALLHGTLPKTSGGGRLVVAFSYAPCFVADWTAADIATDDVHRVGHY
jgi:hypothetical protein